MSAGWAVVFFFALLAAGGVVSLLGAAAIQKVLGVVFDRMAAKEQPPGRPHRPGSGALESQMKALARPTLLLLPTEAPAFSKLGGAPDLGDGATWPTSTVTHRFPRREVTTPMGFVAQLDLAEVRAAGGPDWLPNQGRLYFFAEPWMGAVVHDPMPDDAQPRIAVPALPKGFPLAERQVVMSPAISYPDLEWMVDDLHEPEMDEEVLERLAEFPAAHMPSPEHRIGGHASAIQGLNMEFECEQMLATLEGREPTLTRPSESDWRLLLQVDTDADLKAQWGDGGRLYYWIREADARDGDFSKIQMIGQSY